MWIVYTAVQSYAVEGVVHKDTTYHEVEDMCRKAGLINYSIAWI